ncbi:hypothetical protein [Nodularia sp. NIES-3585]|uniref:hypothetical protein n=1 Tax=Nodularia sp. NIES-3585 TaxID=1973477 RepID=UPI000B5CE0E0|nr:hypothetical protein [Nodularia sp. NIES-3585]GAX37176.1 hypothetical protein NIES3585_32180 [Nodularia sp. NIES-3585]
MLKIKHLQLNWLGIGIICSVISATITPAAAQRIIINNTVRINQPPAVGSFIYGSPIPTPMPVNPGTGLIPRGNDLRDYHSYPVVRPNGGGNFGLINPTLINPTLINPVIRDSTFVNPVIINNNSRQPTTFKGRARVRMNRHRVRSRGRSTGSRTLVTPLILNYPR